MNNVRAKKELGQHFLIDEQIAWQIVKALPISDLQSVIEVGAGMGVLTKYLIDRQDLDLKVVEIDSQSVAYLAEHYAEQLKDRVVEGDFLQYPISTPSSVIGNFPYNISTQIFFHIIAHRDNVPMVVGMLQKEVAQRLAAPAGTRESGVLTILLQTYYDVEYLFSVAADRFSPPPKVVSGVIRATRNARTELGCDEVLYWKVVKGAFSQRRKMLKNALYSSFPILKEKAVQNEWFTRRAENLTVDEFIELTNFIASNL